MSLGDAHLGDATVDPHVDVPVGDAHELDCDQILTEVYLYLDLECSNDRRTLIKRHLDECSPCLREYGIEQDVKALVARCCGGDRAPDDLRARLRAKISALVETPSAARDLG